MKYCRFLQDIYDETNEVTEGKILVWSKYKEYKVVLETDEAYWFSEPAMNAISKKDENKVYKVILKSE